MWIQKGVSSSWRVAIMLGCLAANTIIPHHHEYHIPTNTISPQTLYHHKHHITTNTIVSRTVTTLHLSLSVTHTSSASFFTPSVYILLNWQFHKSIFTTNTIMRFPPAPGRRSPMYPKTSWHESRIINKWNPTRSIPTNINLLADMSAHLVTDIMVNSDAGVNLPLDMYHGARD